MVDFSKLGQDNSADTAIHPRQIFNALPNNIYQYPRDVQTEVWNLWLESRDSENDTVIKMNTGSGKTIVGLLILKSCLNENKGPAIYLCPDNYLVEQVKVEAVHLGISVTDNPTSARFYSGDEILVANIYKLINGKSQFGIDTIKIQFESIVIDDVHACLIDTEQQFTLRLGPEVQEKLLELFFDDLKNQSSGGVHDIRMGEPLRELLVPYWAWQEKIDAVREIITKNGNEKMLLFQWPLVNSVLEFGHCFISGRSAEISIRILPVEIIRSFEEASRRIFMSATIADDSVLVSHFDANVIDIDKAITPNTASDAGDRMILLPKYLNPEMADDEIRKMARNYADDINVVVIVPSKYRAKFWEDYADDVIDKSNISEGVEKLKKDHVGLVVLINKYDGVDLPNDACRLLIVDELPDARRSIDKYDQKILYNTGYELIQPIQQIEQGMGRGVRSSQDYCAVILMGDNLTKQLVGSGGMDRFTPATKVQYELSTQLSEQLELGGIEAIEEAINRFLSRDSDWVQVSKSRLSNVEYDSKLKIRNEVIKQREAFNKAILGDFQSAVEKLRSVVEMVDNPKLKGLLIQEQAMVKNMQSKADAQALQHLAIELNRYLLKPIQATEYKKLSPTTKQAIESLNRLKDEFNEGRDVSIALNSLTSKLVFVNSDSEDFEKALESIGWLLGFESQRPDAEYGTGPDNLLRAVDNPFFIIECKNESETAEISKNYCNQLSGHVNWVKKKYGDDIDFVPIMCHQSHVVSKFASPEPTMRIISSEELKEFRDKVRDFGFAISTNWETLNSDIVASHLQSNFLNAGQLIDKYTCKFIK